MSVKLDAGLMPKMWCDRQKCITNQMDFFLLSVLLSFVFLQFILRFKMLCMLFACMRVHAHSCMCVCEVVRVCMSFPVCLCLREESPRKSQRLSPNYLTLWMVKVWDGGLVEEGTKRRREWMMEGGREGGLCKTIPLTLGHSQTQEMLDLTPWEMSTAAHLC